MRINKKIVIAVIVAIGALTVGMISTNTKMNNNAVKEVLVQVGSSEITNSQFLNYKEQNSITPSTLTDSEILKHMVREELFLQLAQREGVSATLEEGRQEAKKYREILSQQPKEVQDTHKKLMKADGVTEEEHWEKLAPPRYQNVLSKQNLADKLLKEAASAQQNADDFDAVLYLKQFKEDLLKAAISDGKVTAVGDISIY
ncbi:hypothetical protein [Paenibacillus lemnae]|uniref:Peptidylprolyl isomerase n=1 Tax=Paenibacillus lemnae TaxID=1330551 RepID=A0A848MD01_PAELE|nr:hypothetical protein [Paenibacillus lemnae]NMO98119.1 hypothetical protein [Paenibacillus lemnae]